METCLKTVEEAIKLKPDALILQDIGLASLIKNYFPDQTIHASTQMGIHNSLGLDFVKQLGFERTILERQVTLNELEGISNYAKKIEMELEVFIHGALCCSLSGQCLFSSWLGGYSGNRGKCKHPCRRKFDDQFLFSMKDLNLLEEIQKLVSLGIKSFKIEGRLKRGHYVQSTVQAYRLLLDAIEEKKPMNQLSVLKEAKQILESTPARVESKGFLFKKDFNYIIENESSGIMGKIAGKILKRDDKSVVVMATSNLKKGDRLRFSSSSGNEQNGFTLLNYKNLSNPKSSLIIPNQKVQIFGNFNIEENSNLYYIGESNPISEKFIRNLPLFYQKDEVQLFFDISNDGITISANNGYTQKLIIPFEESRKEFDKNLFIDLFKQTANEKIILKNCHFTVRANPFIPLSQLKAFRREFWANYPIHESNPIEYKPLQIQKSFPKFNQEAFYDNHFELPFFCPEDNITNLRAKIQKAIDSGKNHFRINSFYQIPLIHEFISENIYFLYSFPLPIANEWSASYLMNLNRSVAFQPWIELSKEDLHLIINTFKGNNIEIISSGRPSLLTTRANLPAPFSFHDNNNEAFDIIEENDISFLVPQTPFQIDKSQLLKESPQLKFTNIYSTHFSLPTTAASIKKEATKKLLSFNFNRSLS